MSNETEKKEIVEKDYAWKDEQEDILRKWADKGLCFKMMHERAYRRFWCLNAWFNIPVIIISTITGTGNFASGSLGSMSQSIIFGFGALNIFAGILATIATYMGVAQKMEAHRFLSISWDKFTRKLQIELAKPRSDRVKAKDFIKSSAEEYDRLIEMSPILPTDIIRWFTNMIETGQFDDDLNEIEMCCFECFCFPCGCSMCSCCKVCKGTNTHHSNNENKKSWEKIELPEIIGRVKPTKVAVEPAPESPPPLVIVDNNSKVMPDINKETNEYDIYNINV
jgi:hypothetical protein